MAACRENIRGGRGQKDLVTGAYGGSGLCIFTEADGDGVEFGRNASEQGGQFARTEQGQRVHGARADGVEDAERFFGEVLLGDVADDDGVEFEALGEVDRQDGDAARD